MTKPQYQERTNNVYAAVKLDQEPLPKAITYAWEYVGPDWLC